MRRSFRWRRSGPFTRSGSAQATLGDDRSNRLLQRLESAARRFAQGPLIPRCHHSVWTALAASEFGFFDLSQSSLGFSERVRLPLLAASYHITAPQPP
jgi:hypothetical protein